ncbi:MAG: hypothetical protein LBV17_09765 [Treponema sp.]|jgi:hypothetical protein|nr:hypothetical protein [Treponema sp.]
MTNRKTWLGMLVMTLAFGMLWLVGGCENNGDPYVPPVPSTPKPEGFTGTVTISSEISEVVLSGHMEEMTLTANVSGAPVVSALKYQWQRDGTDISGATSKTYKVTADDFGKTLKVIVTDTRGSEPTTSAESQPTSHTPATVCTVTIKYATSASEKGVSFETPSGRLMASAYGAGTTTTKLWSYTTQTQFKISSNYTVGTKFYYKNGSNTGPDLFDLSGTKTYTLTNVKDSFGILTGLIATQE